MRIGLLSTLSTNIGDDFIREGIIRLLRSLLCARHLEIVIINKHKPWTVYPGWHPARYNEAVSGWPLAGVRLQRFLASLGAKWGGSQFSRCDAVVQCGAPVLWPHCHTAEWAIPIWRDVIGRISESKPVLNIAAGSCYPWLRQPVRIEDAEDAIYLGRIYGYCRVTTVRDPLARSLWQTLGAKTELLPCTAALAPEESNPSAIADEFVFVNYMRGGGHYAWEQGEFVASWEATMRESLKRLAHRHRLAFICHNAEETELARSLAPEISRFQPADSREYFALASRAKAGVCNRLHASVALAGMGIPSVSVGTDTRMLMVSEFGLPVHFVGDVTADMVEAAVENAVSRRLQERDRLKALVQNAERRYMSMIGEALCLDV